MHSRNFVGGSFYDGGVCCSPPSRAFGNMHNLVLVLLAFLSSWGDNETRRGDLVEQQNPFRLAIHGETERDRDSNCTQHGVRSKDFSFVDEGDISAEAGGGLALQKHAPSPLQASAARRLSDRESETGWTGAGNGKRGAAPSPQRQDPSPRRSGASGVVQQSGANVSMPTTSRTGGQHLSDKGATGAVVSSVQSSSPAAVGGEGALPLVQFFGSRSSLLQPPHLCAECNTIETAVGALRSIKHRRRAAAREAAHRIAALESQHFLLVSASSQREHDQGVRPSDILASHQTLQRARREATRQEETLRGEEASMEAFIRMASQKHEREEQRSLEVLRQLVETQIAELAVLRVEAALGRQRELVELERRRGNVLAQALVTENHEEYLRLIAEEEVIQRQIEQLTDETRTRRRGRRKPT
ncbi:UNVERIFIED_CONTAM: hypothetical protein HHA_245428 [Hammondia hammondi]|eukprot:XP_008888893.1 hypothetical protein HHA_245428 [Hammondia hammondi]